MLPAAAFDALVPFADAGAEAAKADTVPGSPCPDPFISCVFVAERMAAGFAEPHHFRTAARAAGESGRCEDGRGKCVDGGGRGRVDGVVR